MTQSKEMSLPKLTFGWELEAVKGISRDVVGIEVDHDGSVNGDALEYRVKRELVFDPDKSLAALRAVATDPALRMDRSCGFHVHIGLGSRTRRLHAWAGWFVQLARDVEDTAFMAVPATRRDNRYCKSWRTSTGPIMGKTYSPSKHSNADRYNWINATEIFRPGGIRTIEVRLMGATNRYPYLLAWAGVCRMMAMSSWRLMFDPSRLESERADIKKAFHLIKGRFLDEMPSKTSAVTALMLGNEGLLNVTPERPLGTLVTYEYRMEERVIRRAKQLEEYERLAACIGDTVREFPPLISTFRVGQVVTCRTVDPDDGITVGRQYEIQRIQRNIVIVRNDDGNTWEVPAECFYAVGERVRQEV